jgi:hypothetical protein
MHRRSLLLGAASALGLAGCSTFPGLSGPRAAAVDRDDPFVHELQERTFRWFADVTPVETGLTPDRWPNETFCSVAAVGFALTVWPIGVRRGWMSRDEARTRTLNTLRFFRDLPQGPETSGVGGHRGFFYHFLNERGHRFGTTELSTIDTTLFLGGALFAAGFFDGADRAEAEIRRLADALYARVEWTWITPDAPYVSMGWHPEDGGRFIEADWSDWNEAALLYLLALGSPTHPLPDGAWQAWTANFDKVWGTPPWGGQPHLQFAPMFGHQYSHLWVDFRGVQDAYMRAKGIDYFENSRRATYAQRAYAVANPGGWHDYGAEIWGLTACDGPGDFKVAIDGREREFFSYSARGPGERDDGTLAPTALGGSIPFAPEITVAGLKSIRDRYGEAVWTRYGFLDSFNPTLTRYDGRLQHGKIVPGVGWVDGDYLGIDQGPIVAMIENWRSDLVWTVMRKSPHLRRGLRRAGFSGGWLDEPA